MSRYGVSESQRLRFVRAVPLILAATLYLLYHLLLGPDANAQADGLNAHPSHNRTLGFGEILVAIVPSSTAEKFHHQLDTLSLTSHLSHIDLRTFEGGGDKKFTKIWRGHMLMLRHVLDRGLSSALILEGDADWDARVKDQLQMLSENLPGATHDQPYGSEWMALWLSYCGDEDDAGNSLEELAFYEDETATVRDEGRKRAREVLRSQKSGCTTAYAVTAAGAQKILDEIGFEHVNLALEKAEKASYDLPGLIVNPPLFEKWTSDERLHESASASFLQQSIRRAALASSRFPGQGRAPGS